MAAATDVRMASAVSVVTSGMVRCSGLSASMRDRDSVRAPLDSSS